MNENAKERLEKHIDDLPNELLQNIFEYLGATDAINCRMVSKRWRDNVDCLESVWKKLCEETFINPHEDFKKTKLSWKQLFKSLKLWSRAHEANLTGHKVLDTYYHDVFIRNGFFSVLKQHQSCNHDGRPRLHNSVTYYDIFTLKEHHTEVFDISFAFYEERDDFFAVTQPANDCTSDVSLYFIPKFNKNHIKVGTLHSNGKELTVLSDRICFRNTDKKIVTVQIKGTEISTKTSKHAFNEEVLRFSCVNIHLYILTLTWELYSVTDEEFKKIDTLCNDDVVHTINNLTKYGFEWHSMPVIEWLNQQYQNTSPLLDYAYCTSGNIVMMGADERRIKLFYNPYDADRNLKLFTFSKYIYLSPIRIVHLDNFNVFNCNINHIGWVGAVCMENLHRIFVTAAGVLFVLDFDYKHIDTCLKARVKTLSEKEREEMGPSAVKSRRVDKLLDK